jgi:hypothetical protein
MCFDFVILVDGCLDLGLLDGLVVFWSLIVSFKPFTVFGAG